jgi:hypothetical protein
MFIVFFLLSKESNLKPSGRSLGVSIHTTRVHFFMRGSFKKINEGHSFLLGTNEVGNVNT